MLADPTASASTAVTPNVCNAQRLGTIQKAITFYRERTEDYRSLLGVRMIRFSHQPIKSCAYGQWVAGLWKERTYTHKQYLHLLESANRNFNVAATLAARIFHTTRERLYHRASVEGGHGSWYCNHSGSGACGWFQFMEGTYYGRSYSAFAIAKKRGFPIPAKYNSWYSVLGQNLTAAYMFELGLECSGEGWAASC